MTRNTPEGQQTIDAVAFQAYAQKDLIPLYRYTDTSMAKNGRERKDGKRPLHANWTTREYNARKVISLCIKEGRNLGHRIAADELVVDVDPRNGGGDGFNGLMADLGIDSSEWPRNITGSGGYHYFLRKPADVPILDTLKDYPGVEFKSKDRQVVAAGSIHPDTKKHYRFDDERPGMDEAPPCPKSLLKLITRPQRESDIEGGQYSIEQIVKMLDSLDVTDFKDESKWRTLMMAVHDASGGEARQEFIDFSTGDADYADDADIIGRRWDSCHTDKDSRITYRTLRKFIADEGDADAMPQAEIDEGEFFGAEDPEDMDFEGESNPDQTEAPGLTYEIAEDIEAEKIRWLWPGRFAIGKLGILAGFPDAGKSQITMNIAAIVSKGGKWPNGEGRAKRGAVLILSAEDDAADTVKPRLMAAGADLSQCIIVKSIVRTEETTRVLNLSDDLSRLTHVIRTERDNGRTVHLVIIDPISAYMGGRSKGDTFKNTEVRALLTPLVEWAAAMGVAIIAISHFNKSGNGRALYRVTDSLAFTAAARTVWLTVEEEATGRKLFLKGKNNIAADPGGLAYVIEGVTVADGIEAPRIVWDGPVDVTAEEALGQGERKETTLDTAKAFLGNLLAEGPRPASEVLTLAKAAGYSEITIRRAKSALAVQSIRDGFDSENSWRWSLSEDEDDPSF